MRATLLTIGLVLCGVVLSAGGLVRAQVADSSVSIDVVPPNPAPGEAVTINLNSYVNNLDGVSISWFVGGKNVLSGFGKKSFSLTAPALGGLTVVTVRLSLPDGLVEEKINIVPSMMVLLWEATNSYVPPFYRGKALLPEESEVKVVAMPELRKSGGGIADPKTLIYSWQKDYSNDGEGSGYGRNFFLYTSDFLDPNNNVAVSASTVSGGTTSEGNINVPTTKPKIIFYRSDPKIGTHFEQELVNGHKIDGEETIVAAPYFIYPRDLVNPRLTFDWLINDFKVPVAGIVKNVMPVKVPEGVTGTSTIHLEVNNVDKIFESATKEINVEF